MQCIYSTKSHSSQKLVTSSKVWSPKKAKWKAIKWLSSSYQCSSTHFRK